MAEYIEREALLSRIKEAHCAECDDYHGVRCRACWVDDTMDYIDSEPAAKVVEVKRGRWELEAHKENSNYGWNVTAECPECRAEKKMVWRGLFPHFCDALAKEVAIDNSKSVKLSNFCPNCGADMREVQEDG